MPTYRPTITTQRRKPFHARVRFMGKRYSLGYYATYEEAEDVEQRFIDGLYGLALLAS